MNKNIKLIAVIPAHLASVRLKRKVLIKLFGLPMIEHVRRRVVNSNIFDEVRLKELISKTDVCVNLIGILHEKGKLELAKSALHKCGMN